MKAITFDEAEHKYQRGGAEYVSVTTLIHKYCPPFEGDYWSTYKGVKDVFEKYGQSLWKDYKRKCGGWQNVVGVYNTTKVPPFKDEVIERKQYYLDKWAEAGHIARVKGTKVHKDLEDEVNDSLFITDSKGSVLIPQPNAPIHDPLAMEKNAALTEIIVFNDKFNIAGMVDRVDKKGKTIHITDYKTSKEITRDAFMDSVLFEPVDHLPNANYFIYSLQLSLYAWMLEQFGYTIGDLKIEHRDRETGEFIESYPVSYLRNEINLILNHYGKTVL